MRESELIDLGFQKVEINDADSQNGYDYFYYILQVFDNLTLSSTDSDVVKNGEWFVHNLDWPRQFQLSTKNEVMGFLQTVIGQAQYV
jgi:hypothetical protein